MLLATQITAPGKSHGQLTLRIRERCKFPLCRHSCISLRAFMPLRADRHVIAVSCGRREPLHGNRQGEVRFRPGGEPRCPGYGSDGGRHLRQAIPDRHWRPLDLHLHRTIGPQPEQNRFACHVSQCNPLRQQIRRNDSNLRKGTPGRNPFT